MKRLRRSMEFRRTGRLPPVAVLLAGALVLALAGCGTARDAATPSPAQAEITVSDDAGNRISLSAPAERIVSLAPSQTEMIYAVGAGDRLVGNSDFCDYPEEAKAVEKIGDFANPNVERIVSLEPDLVVAAAGEQRAIVERLGDLKVPVVVLDPSTIEGMLADLEKLGLLVGEQERAKQVADSLRAEVEDVASRARQQKPVRVFFEIYGKPLMAAGAGTLIEDLVRYAGGVNIGSQAGEGFPEFSQEVLLAEDPDVYIAVAGSQADPGDIAGRAGYDQLTAVKKHRVFVIEDNLVVRSGPRAVQGLRQIAAFLHPSAFEAAE